MNQQAGSAGSPQRAAEGGQTLRKPRHGDRFECRVEGLGRRGSGFARYEDASGRFEVELRHSLPGTRVLAEVIKRRGAKIEARIVEQLEPSADEVADRCRHTHSCGGCSFQNLAYERQLVELRELILRALLEGGVPVAALPEQASLERPLVEAVLGCAQPWNYRNKMDFTFGNRRYVEEGEPLGAEADFALGLHAPGRYEKVLDIHECHLAFEGASELLASARELAREQGLSAWDVQRHTGLLRHLVLRKGVATGELLVYLVTSEEAPELVPAYARALLERHPEITTFVQGINTRPASIAVGERELVLFGPGLIREHLFGLEFELSALSFFQTNTSQAERLLQLVAREAAPRGDELLLDLYCGAGTLGLALASQVRELWGFESVPEAVADAKRNAIRNGVDNAHFLCGDVLALLRDPKSRTRPAPDVVLVDPPRAGLHPNVVPALVSLGARRIVYVSCNIHAAAADVAALALAGYRLRRVQAVDLFPHTPHVECVLTLDLDPQASPLADSGASR